MHNPTRRVVEILNYIMTSSGSVSLTELSCGLSIPKSTLVPILQTLCEVSYISKDNSGYYLPGIFLYSVGTQLKGRFPILDFAKKQLKVMADELGETCYFGILDEGYVFYLDKAECTKGLQMLISTGKKLPAYSTGIGKALLNGMTKAELKNIYPDGLMPVTQNTVTDFDILENQLSLARKNGFCEEIEESTEHIRCIGVPVYKYGKTVAAISVAIPVFRYDENERERIIQTVKNTALQIQSVIEKTDANIV